MIFFSYNYQDKEVVDQFADAFSRKYGFENIFYDNWSIKPGDSIIEKMNDGLVSAKTLVLFVSENSNNSGMVKLEWQTALQKRAGGNMTVIPVRIDDTPVPLILNQIKYIDCYTNGLDVALAQLDEALEGNTSFSPMKFQPLVAKSEKNSVGSIEVTIEVTAFQEPISKFCFVFKQPIDKRNVSVVGENMFGSSPNSVTIGEESFPAFDVTISRAITKAFPMKVIFSNQSNNQLLGVLKYVKSESNELKAIPLNTLSR